MNDHGKLMDVLIFDYSEVFAAPDDKTFKNWIVIYAENGYLELIKKIPGVLLVIEDEKIQCRYQAYLDPRYNHEIVKKEIEAEILCA